MPWIDLRGDIARDFAEQQDRQVSRIKHRDPLWAPPETVPFARLVYSQPFVLVTPPRALLPKASVRSIRSAFRAERNGPTCGRCGRVREMREGSKMPLQCQCWRLAKVCGITPGHEDLHSGRHDDARKG